MKAFGAVLAALTVATAAIGQAFATTGQQPFAYASQSYDEGLFTPFEDLQALSSSEFTSIGHPLFPNHNVRIKKSHFCDESVK
jgi:hypothetical protein